MSTRAKYPPHADTIQQYLHASFQILQHTAETPVLSRVGETRMSIRPDCEAFAKKAMSLCCDEPIKNLFSATSDGTFQKSALIPSIRRGREKGKGGTALQRLFSNTASPAAGGRGAGGGTSARRPCLVPAGQAPLYAGDWVSPFFQFWRIILRRLTGGKIFFFSL